MCGVNGVWLRAKKHQLSSGGGAAAAGGGGSSPHQFHPFSPITFIHY